MGFEGKYNVKGEPHGFWSSNWSDGQLAYEGHIVNGILYGYWVDSLSERKINKLYYAR